MKNLILATVISTAATAGIAQQAPYATVTTVEGLVTVTSGNLLTNVTPGMPLPRGAQLVNTSTGKATVVFGSGCAVTLEPNQTLLVEESVCTEILARGAGAGGGGAAGPGAFAGGLFTPTDLAIGALGLGVLSQVTRSASSGS
jgi:hypothetical protein